MASSPVRRPDLHVIKHHQVDYSTTRAIEWREDSRRWAFRTRVTETIDDYIAMNKKQCAAAGIPLKHTKRSANEVVFVYEGTVQGNHVQ